MTDKAHETIQIAVVSLAVVASIIGVATGIVILHRQSNDYWKPITLSCIEGGGTLATNGQCYGVRK